jgi:hypothetical protein
MKSSLSETFENIRLLRALVAVFLLCALWFKVAPDSLPSSFREAERLLDRPMYAHLDNITVLPLYARSLLCLLLCWPTRSVAWLFIAVEAVIVSLGLFSGALASSAVDGFVSGIQTLAEGAIIAILYIGGIFGRRNSLSLQAGEHERKV